MSKSRKLMIAMVTLLGVGILLFSGATDAGGGKDKAKPKVDPKALKKILNATDPEIKAAQKALRNALIDLNKAKVAINKAMIDEVFGEKGVTEGVVLVRLNLALIATNASVADCQVALLQASIAQLIDKGKD